MLRMKLIGFVSCAMAWCLPALAVAYDTRPVDAMSAPLSAEKKQKMFKKGSWLLRTRLVVVDPDESGTVTPIGGDPEISTAVLPELDLTYFLNDHFAIEGIMGIIPHNAKNRGSAVGDQDVGRIWAVAPTVMLQYHNEVVEGVKPYIGAGMAFIQYFEDSDEFDILYKNDIAGLVQAGVDVRIAEKWVANLDVKKAWADTHAKVDGGEVRADVTFDPLIVGVGVGYKF